MVAKLAQQRPDMPFQAEYLGPFVEWGIGGGQNRASLLALVEDLEGQICPGAAWVIN